MHTEQIKSFTSAIKTAILHSQVNAVKAVNTQLVQLYFVLGAAISAKSKEAKWGDKVLENISKELQKELKGLKGFSAQNLKKMRLFYEAYPEQLAFCLLSKEFYDAKLLEFGSPLANEIQNTTGSPLANQLQQAFWQISFTNHVEIFTRLEHNDEKHFFIEQCHKNSWSKRVLQNHIKNKIHLQNQLPNNFNNTISAVQPQQAIAQFRDAYLLDFINIDDADSERIIEDKIVQNIKDFILHMGKGFAFMGNQYRLEVNEEEFFIDLLFYNRQLQCMVAFELKRGKFKPEHIGQLSFYLNVLDDKIKLPHENQTIGIVLCKEKSNTVVEYALRSSNQPMGVAVFKTKQEMPANVQEYLPSVDELTKLIQGSND
jgi:predicted nuclease of restriction endonuclease-like (RecB) superfamily